MSEADLRRLLAALERVAVVLEQIRNKIPPMEGGLQSAADFPEVKQ
jgi:hypothetical protein